MARSAFFALMMLFTGFAHAEAADSGVCFDCRSQSRPQAPGRIDTAFLGAFSSNSSSGSSCRNVGAGGASYYGREFHGRRTASGQRFSVSGLTAAHRTLPFGTRVRVTNKRNGRSVWVTITDRGPCVRGRVIDLSPAAFSSLGSIASGVLSVQLEACAR